MKCIDYGKAGCFAKLFSSLDHDYEILLVSDVVPPRGERYYTDGIFIKRYVRSEEFLRCRLCGAERVEENEFPASLIKELPLRGNIE